MDTAAAGEQEPPPTSMSGNTLKLRQEAQEIKEVVHGIVHEAPFSDKVDTLHAFIEDISEEVKSWRNGRKGPYLETLETLKQQVDEVRQEWTSVAGTLKTQRERLEALLEAFPGAIETSAMRALSLRVTHLEQLVSELVEESRARSTAKGSRTQLIVALGTTVVLWGVWIGVGVLT
jgi:signal transduction histidine kinase